MYDGRVVFEIDANTKNFDNQIEKVEEELNDLLNRYEETQQMEPFKGKDEDLRNLGIEIEKTANKLKGLRAQQQAAQQESKKTGTSISKSFEKGLKSVKKLALGIIGIRSAYMLARRAASAYMSQDEELTKKIQSAWVGLGAFLAPFLEWFSEIMLKAVGYLNEFIKALTGNDYIAEANAKALEKQAKAQSNLNKEMQKYQQYDFDVIRTQQDMSSYNIGSSSGETSGLIDIPELNEKIVKKLQDLAKWLKENKDLIEDIGIALGVTFGAVAIGNLLANIGALIGSGTLMTGLAGLAAILAVVAGAYIIKLIIDGKEEITDLWNKVHDLNEWNNDKEKNMVENWIASGSEEDKEKAKRYQKITDMLGLMEELQKEYDYWQSQKEWELFGIDILGTSSGAKQNWKDQIKQIKLYVTNLMALADANMLTEEGYKDLIYFSTTYGDVIGTMNDEVSDYYISQERLNYIIGNYSKIFPNAINNSSKYTEVQKKIIKNSLNTTDSIIEETNAIKGLTAEYGNLLIAFKKEHPEIKLDTEEGMKAFQDFVENTLGELPPEMTTKINVDKEDADKNIIEIGKGLGNIPKSIPVTVEVKADTSNLKDKFQKLINVFPTQFLGFGQAAVNSLDYFATGGYVSQPTLAVVGEGRTRGEYMIPDGEDYISRLAAEIGQYSGGNGVTNIYLDGRLIQRQISKTEQGIKFAQNR